MFDDNGSFLLAMFEFFIFFAWFMSLWWIFGDLFRSKDLGGFAKALWVVFIIALPFIGTLAYLLVRGRGMTDRAVEAEYNRQSTGNVTVVRHAPEGWAAANEDVT